VPIPVRVAQWKARYGDEHDRNRAAEVQRPRRLPDYGAGIATLVSMPDRSWVCCCYHLLLLLGEQQGFSTGGVDGGVRNAGEACG
jgi:hypothetical protein